MQKALIVILWMLLGCAASFGQSSFQGLTPGKSTKADVELVLGQPVNNVSATLIEYEPQPLTGKIFVQYRKGSPVVERIEMLCQLETSTCADLIKSLNLRIPQNESMAKFGEKWKLLYGLPLFIGTSGSAADESDGPNPSRVAFYSRELYEADFESVNKANEADFVKSGSTAFSGGVLNWKAIENPDPAYPAAARVARASGTVRVQVTVDEEGRVVEARVVSGHPLLQAAAVAAARQARLTPTMLSGRPVKVTGTLIYNFTLE